MRVTVVVDEGHRPAIQDVCRGLRAEGMHVEQVLDRLGLITGEVAEDRLPAVRGLEGVASVERAHRYRLPPPDAPVQ